MSGNVTLEEFFSHIAGSDSVFLPPDEADRFVPACCAMANGTGGWIVFGASVNEDGPVVEQGVAAAPLEEQLTALLRIGAPKGVSLVSYFSTISGVWGEQGEEKEILAARVEPADWRSRPLRVGKDKRAYRRVEGENVASGRDIRWRLALDALELSRDDELASGLTMADLDEACAASFRKKINAAFPQWEALSMENFLKRTLVLDENGKVTRAGELLLGKNRNIVRCGNRNIPNLWTACETFLPRMTAGLTASCAAALRECLINAMLHSEHDAGLIEVKLEDGAAVVSNPGLPRSLTDGVSQSRNYRLMRIFVMAGLAEGDGRGLGIIREYAPNFSLSWDMLELVTVARLPLSAEPNGAEPCGSETDGPEPAEFAGPGWLPVAREEFTMPAAAEKSQSSLELYDTDMNETDELDDEYLGTPDDGEDEKFSQLVRQVRDTPRMPFEAVRDAILELCAEYMSLAELASTLARSEGSLRRHYITSMVKENLLEMEFPDRVGHPDQRYKTRRQ